MYTATKGSVDPKKQKEAKEEIQKTKHTTQRSRKIIVRGQQKYSQDKKKKKHSQKP